MGPQSTLNIWTGLVSLVIEERHDSSLEALTDVEQGGRPGGGGGGLWAVRACLVSPMGEEGHDRSHKVLADAEQHHTH